MVRVQCSNCGHILIITLGEIKEKREKKQDIVKNCQNCSRRIKISNSKLVKIDG